MKIKRIMAGMLAAITVLGSLAAPMSVKAERDRKIYGSKSAGDQ